MTAIGSVLFCNDCGSLLDGATGLPNNVITCDICGASCKDTSSSVIVSESKPSAYPSALRAKRSEVQTITDEMTKKATIRETCSKCGREEVTYYTLQTRGADEGETVFYNCECGHNWSQNN